MKEQKQDEQRRLHLRFLSKVLSIFSHELQNSLATIEASTGLMMDIAELGKSQTNRIPDQYVKSIRLIDTQVHRALSLLNHYSSFSRRLDSPTSPFSVNEILEELIALIQRSLSQRKITIEKSLEGNMPEVTNDPARIQLVIFCLIDNLMERLPDESCITLKTTFREGNVVIDVNVKGDKVPNDKKDILHDIGLLKAIADELGGELQHKGGRAILKIPVLTA